MDLFENLQSNNSLHNEDLQERDKRTEELQSKVDAQNLHIE